MQRTVNQKGLKLIVLPNKVERKKSKIIVRICYKPMSIQDIILRLSCGIRKGKSHIPTIL